MVAVEHAGVVQPQARCINRFSNQREAWRVKTNRMLGLHTLIIIDSQSDGEQPSHRKEKYHVLYFDGDFISWLRLHFWLYLFNPVYVNGAFDSFFWGFLGWLLLPWTTLMYIAIYPGGILGFDWIWLGMGVFLGYIHVRWWLPRTGGRARRRHHSLEYRYP